MHAHITVTLFCAFLNSGAEETADENNGGSLVESFLGMSESKYSAIPTDGNQCPIARNSNLSSGKVQFLVDSC